MFHIDINNITRYIFASGYKTDTLNVTCLSPTLSPSYTTKTTLLCCGLNKGTLPSYFLQSISQATVGYVLILCAHLRGHFTSVAKHD